MAASLDLPQTTGAGPPVPPSAPARWTTILTAPALLIAVCFACGDAVSHRFWFLPAHLVVALAALFCVTVLAAFFALRLALASAVILCAMLGLFCGEVQARPCISTPLERIALSTPASTPATRRAGTPTTHRVEGTVIRVAAVRLIETFAPYSNVVRQERSQQVDIRVTAVDDQLLPSPEGLRLTIYAAADAPFPQLRCGAALSGPAAVHLEERFLDPGVWDASVWLRQQGIAALGSAHADRLSTGAVSARPDFLCRIHSLQQAASERVIGLADESTASRVPTLLRLSHDDAVMLTAMLTGDRTLLGHRLRVGFERTGSFHLLVVSGMHLAIFSGVVFFIAKRLRFPLGAALVVTIMLSLAYALFTGFGQPVQRAFWMVTLYLFGRMLWRQRHPLNAIGFAALIMLAANPAALFDAGFQMTLLSILAVAGIAVPSAERTFGPYLRATYNLWLLPLDPSLTPHVAQFRVLLRMFASAFRPIVGAFFAFRFPPWFIRFALQVAELIVTSLAIELFMALPMAIYFHRITAVALPVNILIVPILGLLLPLALTTLLVVVAIPKLAVFAAMPVALLLHGVAFLVHAFGAMRLGDLRIPPPPAFAMVAVVGLTAVSLILIRMRRPAIPAALAALFLAGAVILWPRPLLYRGGSLEVSTLDVGQGDSILVVTPHGKTLLIDAGGIVGAGGPNAADPNAHAGNFDVGEDVASPVLWLRGVRRLDAIAITHAHADHIGGMPAVMANFRPRELWVGINPRSIAYDGVLAEAQTTGTQVIRHTAGDIFFFDDVRIRVLAPDPGYHPAANPGNNDSLVLQMQFGNTTALLEGDAESPSEARMLAQGGLHSDFLKIGHHGSRTSTTPGFLAAVAPTWAAISVGQRNFYGHPSPDVLEDLQNAQVRTFRTDMLGLSTFYFDGNSVQGTTWVETR